MTSVEQALTTDRVVDITTIGRTSGQPRRIEIWFEHVDGRTYITGTPGSRGWYANLLAHPDFTFHLKESVQADLLAHARAITGEEKATVLDRIMEAIPAFAGRLTDASPLVEVTFDGVPA